VDHSRMDHSQVDHSPTSEAAAPARYVHGSDNVIHSYLLLDQLEVRDSNPERVLAWNLKGWAGTDLTRIWLRSKGEIVSGSAGSASVEVLYGHSVSTWWDLVAGLRHDFRPGKSRTFGAFGIQGLAPQRIDLSATAYVGQGGQVSARLTAEYELLLTIRLVLQPHVELDLHGKTDADRGVGSGISTVHAGLRLRYEVTRQFAPYTGVSWERAFGKTADLAPGGVSKLQGVAGVRAWF
jgi:copper resistance protein B